MYEALWFFKNFLQSQLQINGQNLNYFTALYITLGKLVVFNLK